MTTCADVTDCLLFRHLALFLGGVALIYHRRSVERSRDQINKTPSFFILNLLKIFVGTIEIIACMFTALLSTFAPARA
jgi:hypothetical protein